jgi:hypothetical protein
MNHGGELLLTLLPWVLTLLVFIGVADDFDFPEPHIAVDRL